jgi:enamine deaminase RidA (YjgF/YER057c/UK114 family)
VKILEPQGWPRPKGYSNGISARGEIVFVSGMVGWDEHGKFVGDDFISQARQALKNIVSVLKEANARPEHIVRMNWYVADKGEYVTAQKELGQIYRDVIGAHYPAMTAVQIAGLVEDGARVEIEVTAVIPED